MVELFQKGAFNLNTWLLFVQSAYCLEVKLTMNNAIALYFKDKFRPSTNSAGMMTSIFAWMNLDARCMSRLMSNKVNQLYSKFCAWHV